MVTLTPQVVPRADAYVVLNLGCGAKQSVEDYGLKAFRDGQPDPDAAIQLINLDGNALVTPDLVCVLGAHPIGLPDNTVDMAMAWHVLEHIGRQGEEDPWFYFWAELYRVLKPGGQLHYECPYFTSLWAWADPTHSRAISEMTWLYLSQDAYRARATGSAMPDYRPKCDFRVVAQQRVGDKLNAQVYEREGETTFLRGTLEAIKPLRPYWEDQP